MTKAPGKNLTSKGAARLLGVSEASVKRWADAGLLPTAKTVGGHRRFRPEDVALFKRTRLSEERAGGIKRELLARADEQLQEAESSGFLSEEALVEETFNALLNGRAEEVSALIVNLYLRGQRIALIADKILCPPMRRVGELWHKGELSIAQEHLATRTAMSALQNLRSLIGSTMEDRMLAICCSVEDDFHEFPVQLAALTLEGAGLEVLNIGMSTPFYALTEAMERFQPRLVCVASTVMNGLDRAAREYAEFHQMAQRRGAKVVLGGAGFADAGVRGRFPADLHAENFAQLEEFIVTLN
ncbi:MAG TPA: B12-binding domain-containing protein [Pyrinomonadaceae bacterium]|nr:B12-binding domain-containing protein [Pyrinomonadaceae bacterium]